MSVKLIGCTLHLNFLFFFFLEVTCSTGNFFSSKIIPTDYILNSRISCLDIYYILSILYNIYINIMKSISFRTYYYLYDVRWNWTEYILHMNLSIRHTSFYLMYILILCILNMIWTYILMLNIIYRLYIYILCIH